MTCPPHDLACLQRGIDHGYQLEGHVALWILNVAGTAVQSLALAALVLLFWLAFGLCFLGLFGVVLWANFGRFVPRFPGLIVQSWPAARRPDGWTAGTPTDERTQP